MPDVPHRPQRLILGIFLALATVFSFAVSDVLTKHLAQKFPVILVVAVRFSVSLVLLLALLGPKMGPRLWQVERRRLVLLRSLMLVGASLSMGLALRTIPVAEAIAIAYIAPLLVMLAAIPILGEKVGLISLALAFVGFLGVLLIVRPGVGLDGLGLTFSFVNTLLFACYHLLTGLLTRTENSIAMLFHATLAGAVVFTVCAVPTFGAVELTLMDLGLMALLGVIGTSGHFLFVLAYREAPASVVAPLNYTHLVWAGLLGWIFFGDLPDGLSSLGMTMIVISGAIIALRAHLKDRATARALKPGVQDQ